MSEASSVPTLKSHNKQVMIVAGEASGDMHGARLVHALKQERCDLTFCGVGGKYLRQEKVKIMFPAEDLAVVGIFEVISHLKYIRQALNGLTKRLRDQHPALLILIDFPDFNLILAKRARKLGIPVFYYISPQVWAWRSSRVHTIAKRVNKLAVILPFEKQFYEEHGVSNVEFVGHPLVDTVKASMSRLEFRHRNDIGNEVVIGLLPGSRKKEINTILPDFIAAARLLKEEKNEKITFLLPLAPSLSLADFNLLQADIDRLNIRIMHHQRYDVMTACDLVMAASGTVALELAILQIPMVVAYRISPLTYFVGRRLIKVKYASLVNLIAGREIVKELIQSDLTAENLRKEVQKIWPGTDQHRRVKQELARISAALGQPGASKNTARLALELLN